MRTYPTYTEAPAEDLPALPSHWELVSLKHVCRVFPSNVDKHTIEGETPVRLCNYTDVYYNEEIDSSLELMAATATEHEIEKFAVTADDVVFTKDSETADDIGIAAYVAQTLPGTLYGYHLSIARPLERVCGRFVKRLFDSRLAKSYFATRANGLTRVGLGQKAVEMLPFPLPPLAEQQAIAAFLDRETAKIDALIEEQRRLIALLKEKRQAVISHAVTKGLDPTAPLKPSGIDWLGDIPAHWDLKPLKWLTEPGRDIMYGIVLPGPNVPEGVPIVKGGDVKPGRLDLGLLNRTTTEIELPFARARLKPRDLVYSIRGTIGDIELVPDALEGANITQDVARVSTRSDVDEGWLLFALREAGVFSQLSRKSLGAAVRGINIFDLKRAYLPVPPHDEQRTIRCWLEREAELIQSLTDEATRAIALLQERRSALISAAVTGKIDVRNTATSATQAA